MSFLIYSQSLISTFSAEKQKQFFFRVNRKFSFNAKSTYFRLPKEALQERLVLEYLPKMLKNWDGLITITKKLIQIKKILLEGLISMIIKLTDKGLEKRI
jgi:predicted NACHT family NTPase